MMRAVLLLLIPLQATAQKVDLPEYVTVDAGSLAYVRAVTDCSDLRWIPLDAGLVLVPSAKLKDPTEGIVIGAKPGRYRLMVIGAMGGKLSDPRTTVVIVQVPTTMTGGGFPGGGPDPPPTEPGLPRGPTAAELKNYVKTALKACEVSAVDQLAFHYWALLCSKASEQATDWAAFHRACAAAAATAKIADKHPALHRTIQDYLRARLPWTDTRPLTAADRTLIVETFADVAVALEIQTSERNNP